MAVVLLATHYVVLIEIQVPGVCSKTSHPFQISVVVYPILFSLEVPPWVGVFSAGSLPWFSWHGAYLPFSWCKE